MTDFESRAPMGTHDVLGPESHDWEGLLSLFAQLCYRFNFSLVVSPMFEDVNVFHRGIGQASDVASKEMYIFQDRGGRELALRPEGTASVVRAFVQHRPTTPWRAWYATPAFRYERPQAGRYRQHHQVGVEVLGSDDAAIDIEVISLAAQFYGGLGLQRVRLLINSMGHRECRSTYVEALGDFLRSHQEVLCDEHRETWSKNPLRVLDCKRPACTSVTDEGPMLPDYLCVECREHFRAVVAGLASLGIEAHLTPRLVRGFDYYTRTTFEFVSDALDSAQNAIGGGGRYDELAEQLGGPAVSGVGFGSGVERLLMARRAEGVETALIERTLDVFVVDTTGDDVATALVDELRRAGLATARSYDSRSMKAQMKNADRSGARLALLVGPQELARGEVTMRDLRRTNEAGQTSVSRSQVVVSVLEYLAK